MENYELYSKIKRFVEEERFLFENSKIYEQFIKEISDILGI